MTLEEKRQLVQALVDEWQAYLRLDDWTIDISIRSGMDPDDVENQAQIGCDLKYRWATLEVFGPFFARPENQARIIAHELFHIYLWKTHPFLAPAGDDALEETIQALAMLFCKLRSP